MSDLTVMIEVCSNLLGAMTTMGLSDAFHRKWHPKMLHAIRTRDRKTLDDMIRAIVDGDPELDAQCYDDDQEIYEDARDQPLSVAHQTSSVLRTLFKVSMVLLVAYVMCIIWPWAAHDTAGAGL